jgi:hypothetical protein
MTLDAFCVLAHDNCAPCHQLSPQCTTQAGHTSRDIRGVKIRHAHCPDPDPELAGCFSECSGLGFAGTKQERTRQTLSLYILSPLLRAVPRSQRDRSPLSSSARDTWYCGTLTVRMIARTKKDASDALQLLSAVKQKWDRNEDRDSMHLVCVKICPTNRHLRCRLS